MSEDRELIEALEVANEDRSRLRQALSETRGQLASAQREQRNAERLLRGLEDSRSWKLTRPLRDAGAAIRSLAQRSGGRPGGQA